MWWHRGLEYLKISSSQRRVSRFIDRDFQLRYGSVVVTAAMVGMLIAVFPIHFFLNQNYEIFLDLAYRYSPTLMEQLERERIWVSTLLFASFAGLTIFFLILSFHMTNRIVGPLKVLRNHLRRLSRGHWYMGPARVRESDEFHDLVDAYNYFYEAFRANLRRDLEMLKQIRINPNDREAYHAWRALMEEKSLQLNLKSEMPYPVLNVLPSAKTSESHDSRRAS